MTREDLLILKSTSEAAVRFTSIEGEEFRAKVIFVFDEDSETALFYELIATNRPEFYEHRDKTGGYSIPLEKITSVRTVNS